MLRDQYIQISHARYHIQRRDTCEGYVIRSCVLFCPLCAAEWARLSFDEPEAFYEVHLVPCVSHPQACHPDLRPVAGSILDNQNIAPMWDSSLLDALPEDLLRREFDLHLKAYLPEGYLCQLNLKALESLRS